MFGLQTTRQSGKRSRIDNNYFLDSAPKEGAMANLESQDHNRFVWQKSIRAALLELDPEILKQRVVDAEVAIFRRLQELSSGSDSGEERQALQDASNTLRLLKKEVLKYPDWRPD
jgi:hypothetical protein